MTKQTILFLAANPAGTDHSALDKEARAIQLELERSGFRDSFALETRWAAEPLDLLRELRRLKPTVVHFSGRSTSDTAGDRGATDGSHPDVIVENQPVDPAQHGLYFQAPDGRPQLVSVEALAQVFGAAGSSVKLVTLNGCYSDPQAAALVVHVDCVIGILGSIRDDAARSFAIGFYGGIGERESVAAAYRQGCAAISLEGLPDGDHPRLRVRDGMDAELVVLADRSSSDPASRSRGIVSPPTPAYANAEVQALSERLREGQARKRGLQDAGLVTDEVDREILQLRRQLREGGQLRAGDTLGDGRYLLIRPAGRGGFSVVWEAHDTLQKRSVAIKVLHHHLAGDSQRRERFFRGARVMMDLKHPAVVRVYVPRGEDEGFSYFVMELVPGGSLRDAVLGQLIEATRRWPIILQVGEALAEAHGKQLVHRDVKPANILLDDQGNAKLTDFDLVGARDTTGGTRTGALGTVIYAAPECLDKPQEATSRADVFSLGMTAIFCLSGRDLPIETFRDPEPTIDGLDCSVRLQKVLGRAVAWEADRRFEDAAALLVALRDALDNRTAVTLNPGRIEDPEDLGDRSPPLACNGISGSKVIAALRFISGKYQGGEFPLRTNREIFIGRSTDLEMVLVEDMVSRRHAKISSTEAEIYIQDMGSANGTFVNGNRAVGRALLHEGDRILVGTSIIKVVAVEGQIANRSEAEARRRLQIDARQVRTQGRPLSGALEEFPLPELLLTLSTGRKSGVLTINNGVSVGNIYLRKGALYFATINDDFAVSPQKSIYRMLTWLTGTFELEPSVELQVKEEVHESVEALLMEGMRQLDEFRNLQKQLPPLSSPLAVPTPLAGKLRELSKLELDTFQLVIDHGQLQKVLDNFRGADLEAAQTLISLMKREFVVVP